MVYFIQSKTTKLIKIGFSRNKKSFQKRICGLSGANSDQLKVLGAIRGGRAVEKAWHENSEKFHAHHEWFEGHPKLLNRIRKALSDKSRAISV